MGLKSRDGSPVRPSDQVDRYLQSLKPGIKEACSDLRRLVAACVPSGEEGMIYGVPGLFFNGQAVVCYAGFRTHCGLYPLDPAIVTHFAHDLAGFDTSKGTIRYTPDHPLPEALVRKIVSRRLRYLRSAHLS